MCIFDAHLTEILLCILVFSWLDDNNLTEVPTHALEKLKFLKYLYVFTASASFCRKSPEG